jgi:hypothetical protein
MNVINKKAALEIKTQARLGLGHGDVVSLRGSLDLKMHHIQCVLHRRGNEYQVVAATIADSGIDQYVFRIFDQATNSESELRSQHLRGSPCLSNSLR